MASATVHVRVRIRPESEGADETIHGLTFLLAEDRAGLRAIVQRVAQATLLQAFIERFHLREAQMTYMDTLRRPDPEAPALLADLQARYTRALAKKDYRAAERIQARRTKLVEKYTGSGLRPGKIHGEHGFGERVDRVLEALRAARKQSAKGAGAGIKLEFGDMGALDQIETTTRKTASNFNILWRQLEFGSGIHAKRSPWVKSPPRLDGPTKVDARDEQLEPGGSWLFGQTHVLGNRPGNFLRAATGLPYETDAILFVGELHRAIHQALRLR